VAWSRSKKAVDAKCYCSPVILNSTEQMSSK